MKNLNEKHEVLMFTGTENYYKHFLGTLFTDGIQYVCENFKCWWFLDLIVSYQSSPKVKSQEFQVWKLKRIKDLKFQVTADDGNGNIFITQDIPFSDFEDDELSFWFENKVVFLPSER